VKRLFIFGTGAHARKVFYCAGMHVYAFVDENRAAATPVAGVPVLDVTALPAPVEGDSMFVAVGRPDVRRRLMDTLEQLGWHLPVLVHAGACVAPDACLGPGALIAAGAVVETGAKIGRGAIVDIGVLVDHDCVVEAFCHLRPGDVLAPFSCRPESGGA
jgi:hypothetical protein